MFFLNIVFKHSLISIAVYIQKKQKGTKRKTRQAKALENARKAPRNFLELLHEVWMETFIVWLILIVWIVGFKCSTYENRRTWKLCLRMFHPIWGQQWDLQALPAAGISALFVGSLPIIHVRSVECAFVQSGARKYMMIPVAWNLWPDW
jgi:hypothetical protein